ncbi:MAG: thioredoxin family protein [Planctomycetaceae bacterium]|nr:thioredoxin family protein [Planctomycetaceae bacterium]
MDLLAKFQSGLKYDDFLNRYANTDQRHRWDDFRAHVTLQPDQQTLLASFVRPMPILVVAGTWCGDCVNQCPIFDRFEEACDRIDIRYFDRDDNTDLSEAYPTCGGARVPTLLFLSEDGHLCGRAGDRTLSKYRDMVTHLSGAACPTGLVGDGSLTERVVQDWLNEFERIQWMLRTSSRLRKLHGD